MFNKIMITVIIPRIEKEYDIYIPNNKKMGTIKKHVLLAIFELSNIKLDTDIKNYNLIDRETGSTYKNDVYVKDTGIKTGLNSL